MFREGFSFSFIEFNAVVMVIFTSDSAWIVSGETRRLPVFTFQTLVDLVVSWLRL